MKSSDPHTLDYASPGCHRRSQRIWTRLPLILAVLNASISAPLLIWYIIAPSHDSDLRLLFLYLLDIPVGCGAGYIAVVLDELFGRPGELLGRIIVSAPLLIGGFIWYYFIGMLTRALHRRRCRAKGQA